MKKFITFLVYLLLACSIAMAEEQNAITTPIGADECYTVGDTAERIAEAKERLRELEYYDKEDKDSGPEFDRRMRSRLYDFQMFNRLKTDAILDKDTLVRLFSDEAFTKAEALKAFKDDPSLEPNIILDITFGHINDAKTEFWITAKNFSAHKKVVAYQLVYKLYDPWNNVIQDTTYSVDTIKNLNPGVSSQSNHLYFEYPKSVYDVSVAISKIRYDDGTIYEVPDDEVFYFKFTLNEFK